MNKTQQNNTYVKGDKNNDVGGLVNATTKRKVGFFSAIMIVVGGAIGAGIFFKQQTIMHNAQGSQIFSLFIWLVAAFGVIAMALALVEITSARNDNLSVIGWCQTFTTRYIYKMCKNYMFYIYLPKTYFYIPLYVLMSIQNSIKGFNGVNANVTFGCGNLDWLIAMFLCLAISIYFIVFAGLSSRIGNIQNWIITSVKFIPLAFAGIIGFVIIGLGGGHSDMPNVPAPSLGFDTVHFQTDPNWFALMSPGLGLFISLGAIFFAYDGFYVTAGLQSEMKEPKKTPMATLVGLILVTIIYVTIAISMSVANPVDGSPYGLEGWLQKHTSINKVNWVYGLFQLLIAIGVIGIINGFAMWAPRYTEDLMRNGEIPFSYKYANRLNPNKPIVGVVYNLIISIVVIIVFSLIGGLGYIDTMNLSDKNYGGGMAGMYSFCDLIGNWNATIAFTFIVASIIGGVVNRKIKKFQTEEKSYFLPMAYCSAIIVGLALFFTFIAPFINLFMLYQMATTNKLSGVNGTQQIVSRIMTIVFFGIILSVMLIPIFIENYIGKKKFGSVELYDKAKQEAINNKIEECEKIMNLAN